MEESSDFKPYRSYYKHTQNLTYAEFDIID